MAWEYRSALLGAFLTFAQQCGAEAQVFQELYAFHAGADGYRPRGALLQGMDGNFYGTTYYGGPTTTNQPVSDYGTVFKITPDGKLTTLASFGSTNTGQYPFDRLLQAADGNFYGVTDYGADGGPWGGIFELTPNGTLTSIVTFGSTSGDYGRTPAGPLVQGSDGCLYGVTEYGGPPAGHGDPDGMIYRLTPDGASWRLQSLYTFYRDMYGHAPEGAAPNAALIQASDGKFYGTTAEAFGLGEVYSITSNGVFNVVAVDSGTNNLAYPYGPMLQASDGNFYGGLAGGGVFRLTPGGTLTTITRFSNTNGVGPNAGLVEANDGNFYGTTQSGGPAQPSFSLGYGTVFKITPGGQLTTVFWLTGQSAPCPGAAPMAGLVQGRDGNLYGTCAYGGSLGWGNVFRILMPGPLLSCWQAGSSLVLSWRTNYTDYTLQCSPDLVSWNPCTNVPAVSGRQYFLTNSISGTMGFFRLKR